MILLLLACSDYDVNLNTKDSSGFDSGDTDSIPVDTDSATTETGETATLPSCEDRSFPGEVVKQLSECAPVPPKVGTFRPTVEWYNPGPGDSYTTPLVAQLTDDNGDGQVDVSDDADVIVGEVDGQVWALHGDGSPLWNAGTDSGSANNPTTPAVGDVDGDGLPEVVTSGPDGILALRGADGSVLWSLPAQAEIDYNCGAVALADLDADGAVEVILGAMILNGADGSLRGQGAFGIGTAWGGGMGVAADIDRDGIQEVVVGNALYDPDGNTIWENGESDGFVAVANFDSDSEGEIVVSSLDRVRLQDNDGTVLWSNFYPEFGSGGGPPTVADFDGDGANEIAVAGATSLVLIETDGTVRWFRPVVDISSGASASAAFDFEGDGFVEIVYADENSVFVLDGTTGATRMEETAHSSATCTEGPAIADVDGDGQAEILYTNYYYSGTERGISVIGDADRSWMPARAAWNQHAYSITNVEDDGFTIPARPDVNWEDYNNFRTANLGAPTGAPAGTDLYPVLHEVCTDTCLQGAITLWFALANDGFADLTEAFDVDIYGETPSGRTLLGTYRWTTPLPAGEVSASVAVALTGVPTPLYDLSVAIDGGNKSAGVVAECLEDNNEVAWGAPVCL